MISFQVKLKLKRLELYVTLNLCMPTGRVSRPKYSIKKLIGKIYLLLATCSSEVTWNHNFKWSTKRLRFWLLSEYQYINVEDRNVKKVKWRSIWMFIHVWFISGLSLAHCGIPFIFYFRNMNCVFFFLLWDLISPAKSVEDIKESYGNINKDDQWEEGI